MKRRYSYNYRNVKSEIKIIPLLDVLLVLLLFFIVTSSIVTQSIEVNLPNFAQSKMMDNANDNLSVIIEILNIGEYSVSTNKNRVERLSLKEITFEVQRHLKLNKKTIFLISGSKNIPYNEVIKILNLLRNSGIKSVGLMTKSV